MRLILDIEADGLLDTVQNIWCVVVKDIDTNEITTYPGNSQDAILNLLWNCSQLFGHNVIAYDLPVLEKLWGLDLSSFVHRTVDTLVLSHLLNRKIEGHSLEAWGLRLKHPKQEFTDFSKYTPKMLEYCINDVELNHKLVSFLYRIVDRNAPAFDLAIPCEMQMQWIAKDMHDNGFAFNIDEAKVIYNQVSHRLIELDTKIKASFLPRAKAVREVTPRLTKHGTISRVGIPKDWEDYTTLQAGCPFTLIEWEDFNPASPKQVVDRLWEAGWKPVDKTKGHKQAIKDRDKEAIEKFKRYGWMINENNLATLPEDAPEGCKYLMEYILTESRRRTLEEWISSYNKDTGRIHGTFDPLGTATQRCSHSKPNLGNVATKKSIKYNTEHLRSLALDYGGRLRSLWTCDPGTYLVGCDMEGAHLRIFAHLINDKEFIEALVSGDKKLGTDPHSVNLRKLGPICVDRDRAKTFVFSFLNGAAAPKVSEIFNCSLGQAREALDGYVRSYPGLRKLKEEDIPRDAARGYFVGVDGRYVPNDSEHLMMGMYLQNMESVLMKHANIAWRKELDALGIRYHQVNWVHDEWVTEVYGDESIARTVGQIQAASIRRVGETFNLRCPMAGEYKTGKNWLEVH